MNARTNEILFLSLILVGALLTWSAWTELSQDTRDIGVNSEGIIVADSLNPWATPLFYIGSSTSITGFILYIYLKILNRTAKKIYALF